MPSTFAWVDFEEKDRQRMMEIVRMFQETDTRDELGIGAIRDTFSDLLFPGTSTIQTRVKYMLFIPWIYLRHENMKTNSREIADRARSDEVALIFSLLASDDTEGVIGGIAKGELQRMPSSVYWAGLKTWGIRKFTGSLEEYHRSLDNFYLEKRNLLRGDDKEPTNGPLRENWDPCLPEPPDDYPNVVTFKLNQIQAEYLTERLLTNCKSSLLAHLIGHTKPADCAFVWEHPEFAGFTKELQKQVIHARNFSFSIHGAALLYNLMLAEKSNNQKLTQEYQEDIDKWAAELHQVGIMRQSWDLAEFWSIVYAGPHRITDKTKYFVSRWIERVLRDDRPERIVEDSEMRRLIENRELLLKRSRARLHYQRPLELWSGAAGTGQLTFRWGVARSMVNDILSGLEGRGSNA